MQRPEHAEDVKSDLALQILAEVQVIRRGEKMFLTVWDVLRRSDLILDMEADILRAYERSEKRFLRRRRRGDRDAHVLRLASMVLQGAGCSLRCHQIPTFVASLAPRHPPLSVGCECACLLDASSDAVRASFRPQRSTPGRNKRERDHRVRSPCDARENVLSGSTELVPRVSKPISTTRTFSTVDGLAIEVQASSQDACTFNYGATESVGIPLALTPHELLSFTAFLAQRERRASEPGADRAARDALGTTLPCPRRQPTDEELMDMFLALK